MRTIKIGRIGVKRWRLPLARFDDALGVLRGSADCGKVLVTMEEER